VRSVCLRARAGDPSSHGGHRPCGLGHRRRSQVAERALRLRLRVRSRHGSVARALNVGARYLPSSEDPHPNFGFVSPENSRRARALAIWATLRAYGRSGYREMGGATRGSGPSSSCTRGLRARTRAARRGAAQHRLLQSPPSRSQRGTANGEALHADGRVYAGSTTYAGKAALRPAIVNWQTREQDIDLLVDVVRRIIHTEAS
jgi:hypothetical protein